MGREAVRQEEDITSSSGSSRQRWVSCDCFELRLLRGRWKKHKYSKICLREWKSGGSARLWQSKTVCVLPLLIFLSLTTMQTIQLNEQPYPWYKYTGGKKGKLRHYITYWAWSCFPSKSMNWSPISVAILGVFFLFGKNYSIKRFECI